MLQKSLEKDILYVTHGYCGLLEAGERMPTFTSNSTEVRSNISYVHHQKQRQHGYRSVPLELIEAIWSVFWEVDPLDSTMPPCHPQDERSEHQLRN